MSGTTIIFKMLVRFNNGRMEIVEHCYIKLGRECKDTIPGSSTSFGSIDIEWLQFSFIVRGELEQEVVVRALPRAL